MHTPETRNQLTTGPRPAPAPPLDSPYLLLAMETSGLRGSVALLERGILLSALELPTHQRSAQGLAPTIRQLFHEADRRAQQLDLIAVTQGPGSFTGLRVGITTAKTLGYATGAQLMGVDTLVVLARQVEPSGGRLWTVIDAQRQELFVAAFRPQQGRWQRELETQIMGHAHWLSLLEAGDRVSGPGLRRWQDRLPLGVQAEPESRWEPSAPMVGQVALESHAPRQNSWQLLPRYYRPSAAEERVDR